MAYNIFKPRDKESVHPLSVMKVTSHRNSSADASASTKRKDHKTWKHTEKQLQSHQKNQH